MALLYEQEASSNLSPAQLKLIKLNWNWLFLDHWLEISLTFWSPNRIWRRAFRLTFIRQRNMRCSPSRSVAVGELCPGEWWRWLWWFRWCWWWWLCSWPCGTLLLSSDWIELWSCLSIISYTESPWMSRSSYKNWRWKKKKKKWENWS